MAAVKCPRCKNKAKSGMAFCPHCGLPLAASEGLATEGAANLPESNAPSAFRSQKSKRRRALVWVLAVVLLLLVTTGAAAGITFKYIAPKIEAVSAALENKDYSAAGEGLAALPDPVRSWYASTFSKRFNPQVEEFFSSINDHKDLVPDRYETACALWKVASLLTPQGSAHSQALEKLIVLYDSNEDRLPFVRYMDLNGWDKINEEFSEGLEQCNDSEKIDRVWNFCRSIRGEAEYIRVLFGYSSNELTEWKNLLESYADSWEEWASAFSQNNSFMMRLAARDVKEQMPEIIAMRIKCIGYQEDLDNAITEIRALLS